MLVGTKYTNIPTTLSDLARCAYAYRMLKKFGGEFPYETAKVYEDMERLVIRFNGENPNYFWRLPDMTQYVEDDCTVEDMCTYFTINETGFSTYHGDEPMEQVMWTLRCVTGYVLHDASVFAVKTNPALSWELCQLKKAWELALQDIRLKELRHKIYQYEKYIKDYNERSFWTESGEVQHID